MQDARERVPEIGEGSRLGAIERPVDDAHVVPIVKSSQQQEWNNTNGEEFEKQFWAKEQGNLPLTELDETILQHPLLVRLGNLLCQIYPQISQITQIGANQLTVLFLICVIGGTC